MSQSFLGRYTRWLWAVLIMLILGIVALLLFLFVLPRRSSPLPGPTASHIREIYRRGQQQGNRADVFSKVGDSITATAMFLTPFGDGSYDLGEYEDLAPLLAHYTDATLRTGNPFNNQSLAARPGWTAQAVLNPNNALDGVCQPGESPLRCEYRLSQPSVALIMFGTNDLGSRTVDEFAADMQQIVDTSVEMGVIPVISTIPPRLDYTDSVNIFNAALRELAASNRVPLWDYAAALDPLPDDGLSADGIHPNVPPGGAVAAAQFSPQTLQYGFTVRNLTALQVLDDVRRTLPG